MKYIYNKNRKTLHKYNNKNCYYSNGTPPDYKFYNTEDEAIAENQKYMRYCKNCFGNR